MCACVRKKSAANTKRKPARAPRFRIRIFIANAKYGKSKNCTQNVPKEKKKPTVPCTNDRVSDSLIDLFDFQFD